MKGTKKSNRGTILEIHVQPKASKTEFAGFFGNAVKLRIQQPPVEGAANDACVKFLASVFKISKSRVVLLSGDKSREKEFLLSDISEEEAIKILEQRGLKD